MTGIINDHVKDEEEEMIPQTKDMFDERKVDELSAKFDEVDERIAQTAK